jgi:Zn-dependent protease with chaperone function
VTRRWLVALGAALAIPIIGWLVIFALNAEIESQWRDALIAHFGSIPVDAGDKLTLGTLCAEPDFLASAGEACRDTQFLNVLRWVGGLAAASAVLIVVVVGVVARTARRSRKRMALLFPGTLKLVLVGSAALLVLQGALILGVLWESMQVSGWTWPWLLFIVGITVVLGAAGALDAVAKMGRRRALSVNGRALRRDEEPALFAEVDDIALRLGAEAPTTILAGFEPNFFVVDADVEALGSAQTGKTMFVSLPVAGLLTREEFRAIVGHELGHLRGDDTLFTRRVSPLYGAAGDAFGGLLGAGRRGIGIITLPVGLMLQAVFGTLFGSLGEMKRSRELEADRAGAEATSALAFASALVKLTRTSDVWRGTFGAYVQGLATGAALPSVTVDYLARARTSATAGSDDADARLGHPFDTHPPTALRLRALGVPSADPDARNLDPADSALGLFADPAALDASISELLARRVRPRITASVQRQFRGPSAALRRAALDDRGLAAAIAMIGDGRGPDIRRPDRPGVDWVALADLRLAPYAGELDFDWDVPVDEVPGGRPLMVVDVAGPHDDAALVLARGTRLRLVGGVAPDDSDDGIGEDVYAGPADAPWASGVVVVRAVGGGEVRAQASGLFVTVVSDWLYANDGPAADEVRAAAQAMLVTSPAWSSTAAAPDVAGAPVLTAPPIAPPPPVARQGRRRRLPQRS